MSQKPSLGQVVLSIAGAVVVMAVIFRKTIEHVSRADGLLSQQYLLVETILLGLVIALGAVVLVNRIIDAWRPRQRRKRRSLPNRIQRR